MKWRNFFICGLAGWCMEIVFTSFGTFLHGDPRLLGQTSLWMFPIYGMAALIDPIYEKIKYWPFLLRGCFYATSIMLGEFLSGSLLRFLGVSVGLQWNALQYCRNRKTGLFSVLGCGWACI